MQPRAIVPQDGAVISDTSTQSVILFYPLCFLYLGAAPPVLYFLSLYLSKFAPLRHACYNSEWSYTDSFT